MSTLHKNAEFAHAFAEGKGVDYQSTDSAPNSPWYKVSGFSAFDCLGSLIFRLTPCKWQKEKDAQKAGKKIQYRHSPDFSWITQSMDVTFCGPEGIEYRVKPDVLRFRNYKYFGISELHTGLVNYAHEERRVAESSWFRGWIGGWQEVEA